MDPPVAFVHVPRTSGMAIRQALRLGTGELHTPAAVLRERYGRRRWEEMFTFSVVRNPWTRALSLYRRLSRPAGDVQSFRQWVRDGLPAPYRDGVSVSASMSLLLTDRDRLMVDQVKRYEDLPEAWQELRLELAPLLSYELPGELPVINSTQDVDLRKWYDGDTVWRVGAYYTEDTERFDYLPPGELTGL